MSEMIERVARAIAKEAWGLRDLMGVEWLHEHSPHNAAEVDRSLYDARMTLITLREPTEAMLDAAMRNWECDDGKLIQAMRKGKGETYTAMIDAALHSEAGK